MSVRILMVASTDEELNAILNRVGFNDRLLSYWFIKHQPPGSLQEYASTGNFTKGEGRGRKKKRVVVEQE